MRHKTPKVIDELYGIAGDVRDTMAADHGHQLALRQSADAIEKIAERLEANWLRTLKRQLATEAE